MMNDSTSSSRLTSQLPIPPVTAVTTCRAAVLAAWTPRRSVTRHKGKHRVKFHQAANGGEEGWRRQAGGRQSG